MSEHRPGDWTCHQHGVVVPDRAGVVPACPVCGDIAMLVRAHPRGWLQYVQPAPERCAGPGRHLLGPGRVTVRWWECRCPPAVRADSKGHATWRCETCGDEQVWPPHEG